MNECTFVLSKVGFKTKKARSNYPRGQPKKRNLVLIVKLQSFSSSTPLRNLRLI